MEHIINFCVLICIFLTSLAEFEKKKKDKARKEEERERREQEEERRKAEDEHKRQLDRARNGGSKETSRLESKLQKYHG